MECFLAFSSKMTNFVIFFFLFFSGSKCPFTRKVISYKSESKTVVVLFWKLQSSLKKDCSHPSCIFLKNEKFHKGVMLVPKLVLSNILLSWKEKEFLTALKTTTIVQPKLVWNYRFFKVVIFRAWDATFNYPKAKPAILPYNLSYIWHHHDGDSHYSCYAIIITEDLRFLVNLDWRLSQKI